jgi:hypothetical protein
MVKVAVPTMFDRISGSRTPACLPDVRSNPVACQSTHDDARRGEATPLGVSMSPMSTSSDADCAL